jgi:uncharacterized membrane protein HdeD (DUF308 family)
MHDDRSEDTRPSKPRSRRLQPARFNAVDPESRHLAPFVLIALGIVALAYVGARPKEEVARLVGISFMSAGVAVVAYRRFARRRRARDLALGGIAALILLLFGAAILLAPDASPAPFPADPFQQALGVVMILFAVWSIAVQAPDWWGARGRRA